jgi:Domain of unknown function (DUF4430)
VTRDRGRQVLIVRTVPAGLTALQALDREADVSTRYGGRFVQSIEGIAGNSAGRRDWFYFVNGIDGDRSAADYELRNGDIAWWDYRSWREQFRIPVVVGAFPEPFLHGYGGRTRPAVVRYEPGLRAGAKAIGRLLRARSVSPASAPVPADANLFLVVNGRRRFTASLRSESAASGAPVRFVFAGDAVRLARDPDRYRFRYEVRP